MNISPSFTKTATPTFTELDEAEFRLRGMTKEIIQSQLETLMLNSKKVKIVGEVSQHNGVQKLDKREIKELKQSFKKESKNYTLCNFIVSSNQENEITSTLQKFYAQFDPEKESFGRYVNKNRSYQLVTFFRKIKRFPFYTTLIRNLKKHNESARKTDLGKLHMTHEILYGSNINFSKLPKMLFPFYKRLKKSSTTLFEGRFLQLLRDVSKFKKVSVVFCIPSNTQDVFNKELDRLFSTKNAKKIKNVNINFIHCPVQNETISIDNSNQIVREKDGSILFCHPGHGAFLSALNECTEDIIYISGAENVKSKRIQLPLNRFRRLLMSKLISAKKRAHEILREFKKEDYIPDATRTEQVIALLYKEFNIAFPSEIQNFNTTEINNLICQYLDRPLRVCAAIHGSKSGESKPCWIALKNSVHLSLVHPEELNHIDEEQEALFKSIAYYVPGEMACAIERYNGEKFNLANYCDNHEGFRSIRFYEDKDIASLQLPGLWNGNMLHWNTILVEMPERLYQPFRGLEDLVS